MIEVKISGGIKVGGFDYSVDTSDKAHRMVQGNNNFGECDLRNHVISLDSDYNAPMLSKTFIHEFLEAVNCTYCDCKVEHERLEQLSYGIHQVMESLGIRFVK
jgi:hypothetical protein